MQNKYFSLTKTKCIQNFKCMNYVKRKSTSKTKTKIYNEMRMKAETEEKIGENNFFHFFLTTLPPPNASKKIATAKNANAILHYKNKNNNKKINIYYFYNNS